MSSGTYKTAAWALLDQAVVSGGNFLTNLVLIRAFVPSAYGAYALILNAILFLNNLHANMIAYPVCMRGARSNRQGLREVATSGLLITMCAGLVNTALVIAACLLIHHGELIPIVALAVISWQCQETLRTVFVSQLSYRRAILGDGMSYIGQAILLAAICWKAVPSLQIVFVVIAGTSLVSIAGQLIQLRPAAIGKLMLREFLREVWSLGKWSTLAKLAAFFTSQAFPWVLAYASGLSTVAAFQSLLQPVALSNPLLLGFNNLIIASIAGRDLHVSAWAAAKKQIYLAGILFGVFFLGIAIFRNDVLMLMYGRHSHYLSNVALLPYCALAYALEAVAMIAGAILGGLKETKSSFNSQLWAMGVSVLIVFPYILHSGLKAAVVGLIAVAGSRAAASWYLTIKGMLKSRSSADQVALSLSQTDLG